MAKASSAATMKGPDTVTAKDLFAIWRDNNYYNDVNMRKGFDFFIGITYTIATFIIQMVSMTGVPYNSVYHDRFATIIPILLFFTWCAGIIMSLVGKRKYLAFGMLFIPTSVLLIFGGCLLSMNIVPSTSMFGNDTVILVLLIAVPALLIWALVHSIRKKS